MWRLLHMMIISSDDSLIFQLPFNYILLLFLTKNKISENINLYGGIWNKKKNIFWAKSVWGITGVDITEWWLMVFPMIVYDDKLSVLSGFKRQHILVYSYIFCPVVSKLQWERYAVQNSVLADNIGDFSSFASVT